MQALMARGLQSLLVPQGRRRIEAIIVNDGSTDHSLDIARQWEHDYPDVFRVIDKPNGNYGSCINAAVPTITATFVRIMDADDWYDTDALAALLDYLDNAPHDLDMVITDYRRHYTSGKEVAYSFANKYGWRDMQTVTPADREDIYVSMHTITYRSDVVQQHHYRQTEGMPYTDNEWITYPLLHIRHTVYRQLDIYRHLLGREGQTMAATQTVMNTAVAELALKMCERCKSIQHLPQDNQDLFTRAVCNAIPSTSNLLLYTPRTPQAATALLDAFMCRHCPGYESRTDAEVISTPWIPLHHMRLWRKHNRNLTPLTLAILRTLRKAFTTLRTTILHKPPLGTNESTT